MGLFLSFFFLFSLQGNFAHEAYEIMQKASFTTLEMEMDYDAAAMLAVKRAKERLAKAQKGSEQSGSSSFGSRCGDS
jgi:hypothetical protein